MTRSGSFSYDASLLAYSLVPLDRHGSRLEPVHLDPTLRHFHGNCTYHNNDIYVWFTDHLLVLVMVVLYWFWGNSCLVLQSPKKTSSLLVWYPPRIHTFKPPSAKAVIKLDRALHISSSWQVVWKISSLLGCFLILERVCIASYVEQVWLSSFYDLLGISSYCVSSTVTTSNITQFGDYLQRFHLIPSYTAKHPQHNRLRTGSLELHPVPRQTSLYIFQGR